MFHLTHDNIKLLQQGVDLLQQLPDSVYIKKHPSAFNVTIGSHFRHSFDFYACFFKGLESGQVDYNLRQRQEEFIHDRYFTMDRLSQIITKLDKLLEIASNNTLLIREDTTQWSHSSVGRELQFLLSHTIHHYALIAFILRENGFQTPPEFGIAPSTLRYWQEQNRP